MLNHRFYLMSSPSFPSPIFSNDNCQKKPKRHECTICRKQFSRPSALQTHIFTHTGEKPFQCQHAGCDRRFAVISNLRRHYRTHSSNEAPRHRLSAEIRQQFIERLIEKTKRRETLEADDARYHKDTPHYAPTEGYFLDEAPSMLPESKSPAGSSSSSSIAASPPSQHRDSVSTLAPLPPPLYPQPIKLPPLEPFVFFEPFASPSLQPLYESMLRAPSLFSADYRPVSR